MRFRLATTGNDPLTQGVDNATSRLFSLPLLQAQAADEAQTSTMKQQLMSAQMAEHQAKADAEREQLQRGSLGELLKSAALQRGVPLSQLGEATDYLQTGQLAGKYQLPGDQQGPMLPKPAYADPNVGQQIMQTLGLTRQALTVGDKSVENIAKATGAYQKQDAVRQVQSDPTIAGRVSQAFAASEGKPLIDNIGDTGAGFNQFTGQGGILNQGLYALYGDKGRADIGKDNAAAAASYASAGERKAQTDKIRQEIDLGVRTGNLQVVTGPNGEVTIVDKVSRTAQPVVGADGNPVIRGAQGGGGKPMTGDQAKANLYGGRMMESDRILSGMEDQGITRPGTIKSLATGVAGAIPIVGNSLAEGTAAATNWTQSPQQQQVEQARRDFVNAVLRRESGAAISQSEFDNAFKQYFPQPGDAPQVLAQKRRNRQIATNLMLQEVPEAQRYRGGAGAQPPAATPPAAGGATGSWGAPTAPAGWSIQRVN